MLGGIGRGRAGRNGAGRTEPRGVAQDGVEKGGTGLEQAVLG